MEYSLAQYASSVFGEGNSKETRQSEELTLSEFSAPPCDHRGFLEMVGQPSSNKQTGIVHSCKGERGVYFVALP